MKNACKRVITCITMCLILGCQQNSGLKIEIDGQTLSGPIQSMWTYDYGGKDSLRMVVKTEMFRAQYLEFSEDRKDARKESYTAEGTLFSTRSWVFNEKGILMTDIEKNNSGKILNAYYYKNGLIEKKELRRGNETTYITTYEYDYQSRLIVEKSISGESIYEQKYVYENGRLVQVLTVDEKGEHLKTSYQYSDEKTSERRFHNTNGEIYRTFTSKFDDAGNIIEYELVSSDGRMNYKDVNEYSQKNQLLKKTTTDSEGKVEQLYTYDEMGNCTSLTYSKNGELIETQKYDFQYDEFGNWVQKVYRYNGNIKSIEERVITYYQEFVPIQESTFPYCKLTAKLKNSLQPYIAFLDISF